MSDLSKLVQPVPAAWVKEPPKGKYGRYVSHFNIGQLALLAVGPHSFEVVETIREPDGTVSGVIGKLTVTVDGREVTVAEVGEESRGTNGERAKNAASDAYKRCWMRLGLGLHLWAGADYKLDKWLSQEGASATTE